MQLHQWITVSFFLIFILLGFKRSMESRRRAIVTGLGVAGITIGLFAGETGFARNWLPALVLPFAYWQTGQFGLPVDLRLQSTLSSLDRRILTWLEPLRVRREFRWLTSALELAYLLCYPLVPGGIAVLHLLGLGEYSSQFWNVVLPPAFVCYAAFPFVQTLPPRSTGEDAATARAGSSGLRSVNLSVLKHLSIQANTFPSGHAAASMAVALVFLGPAPAAGAVFLALALGISGGAFIGRYHYAMDVLIGMAAALAWFALTLL